jgi:hypothetical protein
MLSLKAMQITCVIIPALANFAGVFPEFWKSPHSPLEGKFERLQVGSMPHAPLRTLGQFCTTPQNPCSLSHRYMKGKLLSQHLKNSPLGRKSLLSLEDESEIAAL